MDTTAIQASLIDDIRSRANLAGKQWLLDITVDEVRPLTGGASSLTFIADVTAPSVHDRVVLKVAPPGLAPVRNRDVLRQATVMAALQGVDGVRTPAVRFTDAGHPPDTPPFVAMEVVDGECVEPLLDGDRPRDPATRAENRERYLNAARMLAHLHRATIAETGLDDQPVTTLSDEIDRWTRAFETVPAELQGSYLDCETALRQTTPAPVAPVVSHGDYRLGNIMCVGSEITAIIDWEIWAVGDPRIDLSWLIYFTDEAGHPAAVQSETPSGSPTIAEVVGEYEATLGHQVADLEWFNALSRYKEAAATGLLIKRARRGQAPESLLALEDDVPRMISEALTLLHS